VTTRREFLRITGSGAVVLVLGPACSDSGDTSATGQEPPPEVPPEVPPDELPDPETIDTGELLDAWWQGADVERVRALGATYASELGDADALKAALEAVLGHVSEVEDVAAGVDALEAAVAADFAAVRLVTLHGWHLAETEAGLCALLSNGVG